jgi:hypothetical protein
MRPVAYCQAVAATEATMERIIATYLAPNRHLTNSRVQERSILCSTLVRLVAKNWRDIISVDANKRCLMNTKGKVTSSLPNL